MEFVGFVPKQKIHGLERIHGKAPHWKILAEGEPIRAQGFAQVWLCRIIKRNTLYLSALNNVLLKPFDKARFQVGRNMFCSFFVRYLLFWTRTVCFENLVLNSLPDRDCCFFLTAFTYKLTSRNDAYQGVSTFLRKQYSLFPIN